MPYSLHFVYGIAETKCILVTAVSVCVSVCLCLSRAAFLHYCTDLDVTLLMLRRAPSCAPPDIGRICDWRTGYVAMASYTYEYNTIGRRCNANAYRSTLMLFGQLPVRLNKSLPLSLPLLLFLPLLQTALQLDYCPRFVPSVRGPIHLHYIVAYQNRNTRFKL